jgi:putative spermidine/putrescine transport system substrate-binding protein
MSSWQVSRRGILKASAATAAGTLLGMPALVRADVKEVVIGGPAGATKYFTADVFPIIEKQLGIKILYEGTNSLTNLQKMTADQAAPKMSVVIMDDPVMLVAAKNGLITPITATGSPNLGKLAAANVHQDGMWANYQMPWAGIAYYSKDAKAPTNWADLWDPASAGKVIIPSLHNTEGVWALIAAARLATGKPYKEAQYEIDAGFKKLAALKPSLLNVYTDAPQAINLLEQGEAAMIGGQFSAYTLIRKAAGSPVDLAIPADGGFAMPSGITKVKNGPAGDVADAIVNAFLGPEVQGVLATKAFVTPTNPDTPRPAGYPDASQLFAPDWAFVAKERAGWVDRWNQLG